MTFEEYLVEAQKHGIIDFVLRATQRDEGIEFYIYSHGKNGNTLAFRVKDNSLSLVSETGEFSDTESEVQSDVV